MAIDPKPVVSNPSVTSFATLVWAFAALVCWHMCIAMTSLWAIEHRYQLLGVGSPTTEPWPRDDKGDNRPIQGEDNTGIGWSRTE